MHSVRLAGVGTRDRDYYAVPLLMKIKDEVGCESIGHHHSLTTIVLQFIRVFDYSEPKFIAQH